VDMLLALGKDWRAIANHTPTRSVTQVRSHGNGFLIKCFKKVDKLEAEMKGWGHDNADIVIFIPQDFHILISISLSC